MDRNVRLVIRDEFARYRHFFVKAIYKPLTPRRHPLDWFILTMMYRSSEIQPREGQVARAVRHFYRSSKNKDGDNLYVFMTQVVEVVMQENGKPLPYTTLHWKYSLTDNPLDVIETSLDCSSVVDKYVPSSISRSVGPDVEQVKRMNQSGVFKKSWRTRVRKFLSICRRRRDKN